MQVYFKLDSLLEKYEISQRELARTTGIRLASINEMVNNETIRLPLENLAKLCEHFDCRIEDILDIKK